MSRLLSFNPEKYSSSRYSTVIGVAKRAREISEKPVKMAMEELMDGQFKIISNNKPDTL